MSHVTLTKHHPLCVRTTSGISKTDLLAIHPLTGHKLPVFANATVDVADNQEALFGTALCLSLCCGIFVCKCVIRIDEEFLTMFVCVAGIPNCSEDDKRLADEHGVTYEHVLDDSGLHLVYPEEVRVVQCSVILIFLCNFSHLSLQQMSYFLSAKRTVIR